MRSHLCWWLLLLLLLLLVCCLNPRYQPLLPPPPPPLTAGTITTVLFSPLRCLGGSIKVPGQQYAPGQGGLPERAPISYEVRDDWVGYHQKGHKELSHAAAAVLSVS
jgi:hypothetical protein